MRRNLRACSHASFPWQMFPVLRTALRGCLPAEDRALRWPWSYPAGLLLPSLLLADLTAQVTWSPVQSTPPNAARQALAYDAQRSRLVLFGGHDHYSGVWFD